MGLWDWLATWAIADVDRRDIEARRLAALQTRADEDDGCSCAGCGCLALAIVVGVAFLLFVVSLTR